MAKSNNPAKFMTEVRQEASKVTWPTRRETAITTLMVFVMVTLVSIFFFGVDLVLSEAVSFLLNFEF